MVISYWLSHDNLDIFTGENKTCVFTGYEILVNEQRNKMVRCMTVLDYQITVICREREKSM